MPCPAQGLSVVCVDPVLQPAVSLDDKRLHFPAELPERLRLPFYVVCPYKPETVVFIGFFEFGAYDPESKDERSSFIFHKISLASGA